MVTYPATPQIRSQLTSFLMTFSSSHGALTKSQTFKKLINLLFPCCWLKTESNISSYGRYSPIGKQAYFWMIQYTLLLTGKTPQLIPTSKERMTEEWRGSCVLSLNGEMQRAVSVLCTRAWVAVILGPGGSRCFLYPQNLKNNHIFKKNW